MAKIWNR